MNTEEKLTVTISALVTREKANEIQSAMLIGDTKEVGRILEGNEKIRWSYKKKR
jgi:hypothetical protein